MPGASRIIWLVCGHFKLMPQKIIEFLHSGHHEQKGKNSHRSFHTDYTIKYNVICAVIIQVTYDFLRHLSIDSHYLHD